MCGVELSFSPSPRLLSTSVLSASVFLPPPPCPASLGNAKEESLEAQDPSMGHVLALLTDPYTGGGAMQGAAPGIGVANRLWLFTDKLPFKVPYCVLGTM